MLEMFYPDTECRSTYAIDFAGYYKNGYRGVIFDIDNTLVPHNAGPDVHAVQLMEQLKNMGFQICLLSNNKEPRVASFNAPLQVHYIFNAGKPSKKGYRRAMAAMGTTSEDTLFVGDQLFTDVWGAKRAGIFSILVRPIHPKEEIQIVLKRRLEKPILWLYHRSLRTGERNRGGHDRRARNQRHDRRRN